MNAILQRFDSYFTKFKDRTVLIQGDDKRTMTYGQLDDMSGRIYNYLKSKGIGRESIVLIYLPREIEIFACMIGVWKAGAAFIICEESMAPERVRYILSDSHSEFAINSDNIAEILAFPYHEGREKVSPHDAALIVYTSGSTGNPKGVLHEFGNIDLFIPTSHIFGGPLHNENDVMAINSPLNFVAAAFNIITSLFDGATILLTPMSAVKNPDRLVKMFEENGVTVTFMTPSLYRSCSSMNSQMRLITLGGELCSKLYNDHICMLNGYSLSEVGRAVTLMKIDRPYDITPIGKNYGGEDILLLDEDGRPAAEGEPGEVCFKNDFVRGYIGLPEKTAEAWRDGLFHTNDLGKKDENGNIVLMGRLDDMIKINGNRIEPGEIESVAKRELGLKWVCAKGFITEKKEFVVLYYQSEKALDSSEARRVLGEHLTKYMIPSYFVKLDEIPLLPTGKLNKKALLAPDIDDYRKEYAAPQNDIEKKLCSIMEQILDLKDLGIDDDFYEMGGDSLSSIQVVTQMQNPLLDVTMIYKFRTVRKIAEIIETESKKQQQTIDENDDHKRAHDQLLLPMQVHLFDFQLYAPQSTLFNMPLMWRISKDDISVDRLIEALYSTIRNHPLLQSRISFDDKLFMVQHYDPTMLPEIKPEHVSEKEIPEILENIVVPFHLMNNQLIRARILLTEQNVYLFIDMHHVFSDGFSIQVFQDTLSRAYNGEPLYRDYSYIYLRRTAHKITSEDIAKAKEYHDKAYGGHKWTVNVTPDKSEKINTVGAGKIHLNLTAEEIESTGISLNVLDICAGLKTLHEIEKTDLIMLSWLYMGRDNMLWHHAVCPMVHELPVAVDFSKPITDQELVETVKQQVSDGIENMAYDYVFANTIIGEQDFFRIRNQGNLRNMDCIKGVPSHPVAIPDKKKASSGMSIQIINSPEGGIDLVINCNAGCYSQKLMDSVLECYRNNFIGLLKSNK